MDQFFHLDIKIEYPVIKIGPPAITLVIWLAISIYHSYSRMINKN